MKIQMKNTIHFAHLNVHLLLMNIFDYRQRNGEKLTPEAYLNAMNLTVMHLYHSDNLLGALLKKQLLKQSVY